jgi:hypothetical protein
MTVIIIAFKNITAFRNTHIQTGKVLTIAVQVVKDEEGEGGDVIKKDLVL